MENSWKGLYAIKYLKKICELEPYLDILTYKTESHFVNLQLFIIDYPSQQEDGMVLIMAIYCVIYARRQR
jgi:hypothetical protein